MSIPDKFTACMQAANKAIPDMDEKEINQYINDVLKLADSYSDITGRAAIERAQKIVNKTLLDSAFNDAQRALNSAAKFDKLSAKIINDKVTIRQILARKLKNLSLNVESSRASAVNRMTGSMFDKLDAKNVAYFSKAKNAEEIIDAYEGKKVSDESQKIANAIKEYMLFRNERMIKSDAIALDNIQNDRYLRAIHDPDRLINPKGLRNKLSHPIKNFKPDQDVSYIAWREFIKEHLDLKETFKNTDGVDGEGNLDHTAINESLRDIYNNITTGKNNLFIKTGILKDVEAIKKRRRMFFHWKDFRAMATYNKRYGTGDLFSAVMNDMRLSGNKAGTAEILGAAPEQMYEALARVEKKEGKPHNALWWWHTKNLYQMVTGETNQAVHPTLAAFGSTVRALSGMARLGGLVGQSLSDSNIAAAYATRWDISYGRAIKQQLDALIKQFTDSETKEFGQMMHLQLQHHMGYMGRFVEAQNIPALTGKVTSAYYKAIGMRAWDNGQRMGIMATIGKRLYKSRGERFATLAPDLRKQLTSFNINATEWDALRKHTDGKYFALDTVNNLTNDDLRTIRQSYDNDTPLYETRNELYRKLFSVYSVASDNAILTPGAYEKTMMLGSTKPGTIGGEVTRTIMQFKGFALSYVNRSLHDGWHNTNNGRSAKFLWALQNFGYMLPLSWLSMYSYNLSNGLSMPNYSELSPADKIQYGLQLLTPGFGVFAMGLEPNEQNQTLLPTLAATPTVRLLSALGSAALGTPEAVGSALLGDNHKPFANIKRNLAKSLQYLVPGVTVPGLSPYVKKMLGEKVYIPPGQHQIYGK